MKIVWAIHSGDDDGDAPAKKSRLTDLDAIYHNPSDATVDLSPIMLSPIASKRQQGQGLLSDMHKSQKAHPGARGEVTTLATTSFQTWNMRASLASMVSFVEMHSLMWQRDSMAALPSLNRLSSRRIFEEPSSWHIFGGQMHAFDSAN
jgi:hypothetical protein